MQSERKKMLDVHWCSDKMFILIYIRKENAFDHASAVLHFNLCGYHIMKLLEIVLGHWKLISRMHNVSFLRS